MRMQRVQVAAWCGVVVVAVTGVVTTSCTEGAWRPFGSGGGAGSEDPGGDGAGVDQAGPGGRPPHVGSSVERPAPSSRVARLSPLQWENAVRDLLLLDAHTGFSSELPQDALPAGFLFDNPADVLGVDATQWAGFQRAAALAAALVTSDGALLQRLLPEDMGDDDARARAFIAQLGGRAHRRPLTDAQLDAYLSVFAAGRDGFTGLEPFTAGVRLVIEALLQSPHFLYRLELGETVTTSAEGDTIPLDPFERAARLSFALWNSIPDAQLFDAAVRGDLDDAGVEAHARRMLEDPRAIATLLHFHAQLLEARKLAAVAPSAAFFPDAPDDLGGIARTENELFLEDVFAAGGGLADVLTSTKTFVNAELARIYGVEGDFDRDAFTPVELDPALRRGIFTHVAFLAQNATSVDPDPIHRGVFLAKNIACIPVSAPPANVPPLPPADGSQTNRQRVEAHTEASAPCVDCHQSIINPFGFPYELYDATGAVRAEDNGQPVDTRASPLLDDVAPVRDGVELAEAMATSRVVHDCYARHWAEFALGRPHVLDDAALIERLGQRSLDGASIRELLVTLVTSPAFLERSATELEEAP